MKTFIMIITLFFSSLLAIVEKNMGGSLNIHNENGGAVFEINIK
jgi:hypothetical protein